MLIPVFALLLIALGIILFVFAVGLQLTRHEPPVESKQENKPFNQPRQTVIITTCSELVHGSIVSSSRRDQG